MNKIINEDRNIIVVAGLHYFTNYNFYKKLFSSTDMILDVFEIHQKHSFSNRSEIVGANGKIILTVPLVGGRNQRTAMKDLRISNDENWQLRHWRSIISSYNSSPWFEYYRDELADIYLRPFTFLKDWNLVCMEWLFAKLHFQPTIKFTSEEFPATAIKEDFIDLRKSRDAKNRVAPETEPLVYQQVFQDKLGFIPGLSILDLLFCEGPTRTMNLLR